MPNWVRNNIVFDGNEDDVLDAVNGLGSKLKDKEVAVDFNRIMPMPDDLDVSECSLGVDGAKYLIDQSGMLAISYSKDYEKIDHLPEKERVEALELGAKYLMNIARYGYTSWYRWRIDKWGTKWNACDSKKISDCEICFDTAWSNVLDLFVEYSKKHPDVLMNYTYADEDLGSNCGMVSIKNGKTKVYDFTPDSQKSYELGFELFPELREHYEFENGTYKLK